MCSEPILKPCVPASGCFFDHKAHCPLYITYNIPSTFWDVLRLWTCAESSAVSRHLFFGSTADCRHMTFRVLVKKKYFEVIMMDISYQMKRPGAWGLFEIQSGRTKHWESYSYKFQIWMFLEKKLFFQKISVYKYMIRTRDETHPPKPARRIDWAGLNLIFWIVDLFHLKKIKVPFLPTFRFSFFFSFFAYFFPCIPVCPFVCAAAICYVLSASTYFIVRVLCACVICTLPHLGILLFFVRFVFFS